MHKVYNRLQGLLAVANCCTSNHKSLYRSWSCSKYQQRRPKQIVREGGGVRAARLIGAIKLGGEFGFVIICGAFDFVMEMRRLSCRQLDKYNPLFCRATCPETNARKNTRATRPNFVCASVHGGTDYFLPESERAGEKVPLFTRAVPKSTRLKQLFTPHLFACALRSERKTGKAALGGCVQFCSLWHETQMKCNESMVAKNRQKKLIFCCDEYRLLIINIYVSCEIVEKTTK